MVGAMNLAFTATIAVFPLFAVAPGPMGLSESGFGVLLTTMAIGSVLGSWAAPRLERRLGRARTLALTVALAAPMCAAPLLEHPIAVGALFAVSGLSIVVWNIITVSLRQRIVPDHMLGRVNAGYRLLAWGTMPLGAGLGGLLGEAFGVRAVFVIAAAGALATMAGTRVVTERAIAAAEAGDSGPAPVS
jgi:predicted MFS family arabinose efflux permease